MADLLDSGTIIVLLHPWSKGVDDKKPATVHSPGPSDQFDAEAMAAIASAKAIVVPLLPFTPVDMEAAGRLAPTLDREDVYILATLLFPDGFELTKELNDTIIKEHDHLLSLGFDDVMFGPDVENPEEVSEAIATSLVTWELRNQRMEAQLQTQPFVEQAELRALQNRHNRIMLQEIPRALMPTFPVQDLTLKETSRAVGEYVVFRRLTMQGGRFHLAEAKDGTGACVLLHAIDKSTLTDMQDVEAIYKERRLLTEALWHPNIAQCVDAMQSAHRLYLVFAYAGEQDLREFCSDHPGERLAPSDALLHFDEIASALLYCHSSSVALRTLSIDNVLMCRKSLDEGYTCKVLSCSHAVFARDGAMSNASVGTLPCIAPEVAQTREYDPFRADCWSIGIILLEMAGGLSSTARAVPFDPRNASALVAPSIELFFSAAGSHRQALATIGNVQEPVIESILQALLRPAPNDRCTMCQIVKVRTSNTLGTTG